MEREHDQYPVVFRLASVRPAQLAGIARHARRTCGDRDHVDEARSHLNRILVGGKDWDANLRAEIVGAAEANLAAEVAALRAAGRTGTAIKRQAAGPSDPWNASSQGPLREFVLTARREFFLARDGALDPAKVEGFVERGQSFFGHHFPGQLRHLRLDLDEEAPHLHGVLTTWNETTSARRGTQRLLQPSVNPLLRDYEKAQDAAGDWFAEIGLVRGQAAARARREARETGEDMPQRRQHVAPSAWRAEIVRETGAAWSSTQAAQQEAEDQAKIAAAARRAAEDERRQAEADRAAARAAAEAAEGSRAEAARERAKALAARREAAAREAAAKKMQERAAAAERALAAERQAAAQALAAAEADRRAATEERAVAKAARLELQVAKAAADAQLRLLEAVDARIDALIGGVIRYVAPKDRANETPMFE